MWCYKIAFICNVFNATFSKLNLVHFRMFATLRKPCNFTLNDILLYLVHFRALMSLFHIKNRLIHTYYSHHFICTVLLQQVSALKMAIFREYGLIHFHSQNNNLCTRCNTSVYWAACVRFTWHLHRWTEFYIWNIFCSSGCESVSVVLSENGPFEGRNVLE